MTSTGITTLRIGGLTPARLTVGVISAGRVGAALGAALERAGHVVVACSARSEASRFRVQEFLPDSEILAPVEVAGIAELLILAVPDSQLVGLITELANAGAVRPGAIVVHTSGANGVGILDPLMGLSATRATGSPIGIAIHPAMTFSGGVQDVERLSGTCFGITARDDIGSAVAQSLVLEIGGEPFFVAEQNRILYHAALAHGSNHLVTLVSDALDVLRESLAHSNVSPVPGLGASENSLAERIFAPLLNAALDNCLQNGQQALTGPVARGDATAVAQHLSVLADFDQRIAQGYRALSLRSAQRVGAHQNLLDVLELTND
ncbi:MAG: Rossmann-like and DUF2520 domain-containing protein [Mycobacteriaceae bacterium]